MLGAVASADFPPGKTEKGDPWISVVATLLGGALGSYVGIRVNHPVLGLLNGAALAGNIARAATRDIPLRRAAENLGAHLVATASSVALNVDGESWGRGLIGYLAGAAGSNLFLRRVDGYLERLESTTAIGDEFVGPLSPEQLSKLDRALTPAEQRDVDRWQSQQADEMQRAEEAKGGPKATITVTPKGAIVRAKAEEIEKDEGERPIWQYVLAAIGVVTAAVAMYLGLRGGEKLAHA